MPLQDILVWWLGELIRQKRITSTEYVHMILKDENLTTIIHPQSAFVTDFKENLVLQQFKSPRDSDL